MAMDTRQIEATLRDEGSIVALASAVELSRSEQMDVLEDLRERAVGILESDGARVSEYRRTIAALPRSHPSSGIDPRQYARAVQAAEDAVLALFVLDDVSKRESEVLLWPWISICGPFRRAA